MILLVVRPPNDIEHPDETGPRLKPCLSGQVSEPNEELVVTGQGGVQVHPELGPSAEHAADDLVVDGDEVWPLAGQQLPGCEYGV